MKTTTKATEVAPVLDPADVRVWVDKLGRDVITVPDAIAERLRLTASEGWTEQYGMATGDSRQFMPGEWTHTITSVILAAYGASPVPDGLSDRDREYAEQHRRYAMDGVVAFIVGESAYDPADRWWKDYATTGRLRVGPTPMRSSGNSYRYQG